MADEDILCLITGGTLDKVHDPKTESLAFRPDGKSHLPEMLERARCHIISLNQLMLKDSLNFTDDDLALIENAVITAPQRRLVITHGTGTMANTARTLDGKAADKVVVLTGAMRPFSLGKSDSNFNLGSAIVAVQLLGPGVYIAMNGRVLAAPDAEKDVEAGVFKGQAITR